MWSGKRLGDLRIDSDMTQRELAEKVHVSNSSISAYENSTREPAIETLIDFTKLFSVSTDYLLGLTDIRMMPSVLDEEFTDGVPYITVIQSLKALTPKQKTALLAVLEDMRFSAEVTKHSKRNGEVKR